MCYLCKIKKLLPNCVNFVVLLIVTPTAYKILFHLVAMPETTATNVKIRQWKSQSIYRVKIIVERWKSGNIVKTINDRVKTKINIKTTANRVKSITERSGKLIFLKTMLLK